MKGRQTTAVIAAFVCAFSLTTTRLYAFALLGPYADWMDVTNGFRLPGDIGGPMDITEGYRWNVPVLTYGFDQSFLGYFGSNGVAAVEAAIGILNDLPPASELILTNFPDSSQAINYAAQAQNLNDLKSETLAILLEHLGLAQPTRFVFSVRQWNASLEPYADITADLPDATNVIPKYIIERNFDPQTFAVTIVVNGSVYTAFIYYGALGTNGVPPFAQAIPFPVDPLAQVFDAVADNMFSLQPSEPWLTAFGFFYAGLTYDDVGGLKFLLGTNNLNVEALLPDVHAATTNGTIVDMALRPGVNKITFLRHPFDPLTGVFLPITNQFSDTFVTNGQFLHQELERVVTEPDFLFSAGDTGMQSPQTLLVARTGTTSWINNSRFSGTTNQLGPGVIVPPVKIVFHQLGSQLFSSEPNPEANVSISGAQWGSFDQSTNPPIGFPEFNLGTVHPLDLRLRLYPTITSSYPSLIVSPLLTYVWEEPVPIGGTVVLQTSTNILDWLRVATVTNNGAVVEWHHYGTSQTNRFFRVVPGN